MVLTALDSSNNAARPFELTKKKLTAADTVEGLAGIPIPYSELAKLIVPNRGLVLPPDLHPSPKPFE